MKMLGGDVVARMLKEEGVEKVFGIIDGTYFGLYSSLAKYGIELITPRHETSAAHMAGTYARLTGKLGVCIASNGPGVANILPGLAVEHAEGNRVLCLTSSRRPQIIYPDRGGAYQFFDHTKTIGAMTKYSEPVRFPERIVEIMRQAFRHSYRGRPGVCHVDLPENILNTKYEFDEGVFLSPAQYRNTSPIYPNPELIRTAAEMIAAARFPIIHAGSGIIHANAFYELKEVAELMGMPVTTSWGARGALCEDNDLSIPMIHVEVNDDIRNEADLVLILGSRLGETDWWGKAPNWNSPQKQKVIQVDIDDEWMGRNHQVDLSVIADAKVFLQLLSKELLNLKGSVNIAGRRDVLGRHLLKKEKHRAKLDEHLQDFSSPMNTAHIANLCKKKFSKDAVAVFDGGNTAVWGQFFYKCTTPGHGISTPKMGMLGAGVSQALGAKVAKPHNHVYCIIGDGAMGFHLQEIETAVRNNLNVVWLIACDRQWGMVKMNQQFQLAPIQALIDNKIHKKPLDESINADFSEIEWDKLAQSMGAFGVRVNHPKALEEAIDKALASQKPAVIHIDVDPLKHMWAPSLQDFKKMHQEPAG